MKVILDTNFIVSCIKERIDFISQLKEQGFQIILPREVEQELKDIKKKVSHDSRTAIDFAFQLFEKEKLKKMTLGQKSVDVGLIEKGKEGYYIATLDAEIKNQIPNKIVIFSSKGRVGVE